MINMTIDLDGWIGWNTPWQTVSGPEMPQLYPLVEVRYSDEATSRAVNPLTVETSDPARTLLWRPMIWLREGMGARRVYGEVTPEMVLDGLDDYLFLRIHSGFEQIFEGIGLNETSAKIWEATVARRRSWCAERTAAYRFLVVPEQLTACSDKIPGAPVPSENRPVKQLLRRPGMHPSLIYPLEELLAANAKHPTYQHDDVHFSTYGGFIAYRALMQSIPGIAPETIVSDEQLKPVTRMAIGGYGRLRGRPKYETVTFHPPAVKHDALLKDARMGGGKTDVFQSDRKDLPTLVIFRTSNTTILFPFLLNSFSRIISVAGPHFIEDLIESEKPDVVVTEIVERYIAPSVMKPGNNPSWGLNDTVTKFEDLTGFTLPLPRK